MKYSNDLTKSEKKELPNKITPPITYPDSHEKKTNVTCPSVHNVKQNRDWIQEHQV